MKSLLGALLVLCSVSAGLARTALADEPKDRHVVLICVDGLPAFLFDDPNAPMPTIRKLAASGVLAEGMIPANPSVTWPNHTSMTTGVWPERHGVLFNGVLERGGPGAPVKVNPNKDQSELVHAPTIYDVLHAAKLKTAAINWPCTRNADTLDDNFPDVPDAITHSTPRLIAELKAKALATEAEISGFSKISTPIRDRIWTDAACHVIRERKPSLLLLHVLNVDGIHHRYGPQTPAGYSAVAYADSCVKEVVEAIDAAGIRESTTIFIVSDHGFMAIPQTLQPNVVLRQAGLLTEEQRTVTRARAMTVPEGGISMVYLTDREKAAEDRETVIRLFRERPEIAAVLTSADFAKHGLPQPDDYPQMADLILVAKDGYGFNATASGDDFVVKSETTLGTHGFLATNPKMNATFVASGRGVPPGKKIGIVRNIDVAPTIAHLLDVQLPSADGQALQATFEAGKAQSDSSGRTKTE